MNALDMIDQELARAAAPRTSNKKPLFLFLKEGHKALIRPLYNLPDALVLRKHNKWSENPDAKVSAICAQEVGKACHHCFIFMAEADKKLKSAMTFYLPVYVYKVVDSAGQTITYKERDEQGNESEKPIHGARVLELTSFGTIGAVLKFFREFLRDPDNNGTITENDFVITQSGSGQQKTFVCMPKNAKPMDPRIRALIPQPERLRERILEALPPLVSADQQNGANGMGRIPATDPALDVVKTNQQGPADDDIPEF